MKQKRIVIIAMLALALAALACNLPGVATPNDFPTPPGTITAPADTGADSQPATDQAAPTAESPATPAPTIDPLGGFVTGTVIDAATLPDLIFPAGGLGLVYCDEQASAPAIAVTPVLLGQHVLCLLNFPTTAGSQPVTVTLTDSLGNTFVEVFTYATDQGGYVVLNNSKGAFGGWVVDEASGMVGPDTSPQLVLSLHTSAGLLTGTWTASAATQDGSINVPDTPIVIEHFDAFTTTTSDADLNPWYPPNTGFKPGDTVYVFGVGYQPGAAITVAFYWHDEAAVDPNTGTGPLRPKYATVIAADGEGRFRVEFRVGEQMPKGGYYTVALPQITPDTIANPFTGTFTVN